MMYEILVYAEQLMKRVQDDGGSLYDFLLKLGQILDLVKPLEE